MPIMHLAKKETRFQRPQTADSVLRLVREPLIHTRPISATSHRLNRAQPAAPFQARAHATPSQDTALHSSSANHARKRIRNESCSPIVHEYQDGSPDYESTVAKSSTSPGCAAVTCTSLESQRKCLVQETGMPAPTTPGASTSGAFGARHSFQIHSGFIQTSLVVCSFPCACAYQTGHHVHHNIRIVSEHHLWNRIPGW
jgi:hypothetical protein